MFSSYSTSIFLAALLSIAVAQDLNAQPVTGTLGNASIVENNPPGVVYTAVLPTTEFFNPEDPRGNIKGSVSASASPDGIGVSFQVNFENLPLSGGPFLYHLHAFPVPADGNCTGTLGHLDPFIRGETPACDPTLPQTCQVGDLSGKHGKITSDPFQASYSDEFASTHEGLGSYFGNRSIAIHFGNTTRITCANFTVVGGSAAGDGNATGTAQIASPTATGPIVFTGTGDKASPLMFPLIAVMALALLL